jgi:hypothetical protein
MEATEDTLRADSRRRAMTHLQILVLASAVLLANVLLLGPAIARFIADRSGGPPAATRTELSAPAGHAHAG